MSTLTDGTISTDYYQLIRSQEKVAIFIDNTNLFHTMRETEQFYGKKIDYVRLRSILGDYRNVVSSRFYYSEPPTSKTLNEMERNRENTKLMKIKSLIYNLERANFNCTVLPQRFDQFGQTVMDHLGVERIATREKGLDCEIVYDMTTLALQGHFDTFILVAGDEDYARIVRRLRNEVGINVEVAFIAGPGFSRQLEKESSKFIDLSSQSIIDKICQQPYIVNADKKTTAI